MENGDRILDNQNDEFNVIIDDCGGDTNLPDLNEDLGDDCGGDTNLPDLNEDLVGDGRGSLGRRPGGISKRSSPGLSRKSSSASTANSYYQDRSVSEIEATFSRHFVETYHPSLNLTDLELENLEEDEDTNCLEVNPEDDDSKFLELDPEEEDNKCLKVDPHQFIQDPPGSDKILPRSINNESSSSILDDLNSFSSDNCSTPRVLVEPKPNDVHYLGTTENNVHYLGTTENNVHYLGTTENEVHYVGPGENYANTDTRADAGQSSEAAPCGPAVGVLETPATDSASNGCGRITAARTSTSPSTSCSATTTPTISLQNSGNLNKERVQNLQTVEGLKPFNEFKSEFSVPFMNENLVISQHNPSAIETKQVFLEHESETESLATTFLSVEPLGIEPPPTGAKNKGVRPTFNLFYESSLDIETESQFDSVSDTAEELKHSHNADNVAEKMSESEVNSEIVSFHSSLCDSLIQNEAKLCAENIRISNNAEFIDSSSDEVVKIKDFAFDNNENFFVSSDLKIPLLHLDHLNEKDDDFVIISNLNLVNELSCIEELTEHSSLSTLKSGASSLTLPGNPETHSIIPEAVNMNLPESKEIIKTNKDTSNNNNKDTVLQRDQKLEKKLRHAKSIQRISSNHVPKISPRTPLISPRSNSRPKTFKKLTSKLPDSTLPSRSGPPTPREPETNLSEQRTPEQSKFTQNKKKVVNKRFIRSSPPRESKDVPCPLIHTKTGLTIAKSNKPKPISSDFLSDSKPLNTQLRCASATNLYNKKHISDPNLPLKSGLNRVKSLSSGNIPMKIPSRKKASYDHVESKVKKYIQEVRGISDAKIPQRTSKSCENLSPPKRKAKSLSPRPRTAPDRGSESRISKMKAFLSTTNLNQIQITMQPAKYASCESLTVEKSKSFPNLLNTSELSLSKSAFNLRNIDRLVDLSDNYSDDPDGKPDDEQEVFKVSPGYAEGDEVQVTVDPEDLIGLVFQERKGKQEAKRVLSELQTSYDCLLKKYAAAENALDQVRFGGNPPAGESWGNLDISLVQASEKSRVDAGEESCNSSMDAWLIKLASKQLEGDQLKKKVLKILDEGIGLEMAADCGALEKKEAVIGLADLSKSLKQIINNQSQGTDQEMMTLLEDVGERLELIQMRLEPLEEERKNKGAVGDKISRIDCSVGEIMEKHSASDKKVNIVDDSPNMNEVLQTNLKASTGTVPAEKNAKVLPIPDYVSLSELKTLKSSSQDIQQPKSSITVDQRLALTENQILGSIEKVEQWQKTLSQPNSKNILPSCYGSLPTSPTPSQDPPASPTLSSHNLHQQSKNLPATSPVDMDSGCPGSDRSTLWLSGGLPSGTRRLSPGSKSKAGSREVLGTPILYNLEEEKQSPTTDKSKLSARSGIDQNEKSSLRSKSPRDIVSMNNSFVASVTIEKGIRLSPRAANILSERETSQGGFTIPEEYLHQRSNVLQSEGSECPIPELELLTSTPLKGLTRSNAIYNLKEAASGEPSLNIAPYVSDISSDEQGRLLGLSEEEFAVLPSHYVTVHDEFKSILATPKKVLKPPVNRSLLPGFLQQGVEQNRAQHSQILAEQIDNEILELRNFFEDHREEMLSMLHGVDTSSQPNLNVSLPLNSHPKETSGSGMIKSRSMTFDDQIAFSQSQNNQQIYAEQFNNSVGPPVGARDRQMYNQGQYDRYSGCQDLLGLQGRQVLLQEIQNGHVLPYEVHSQQAWTHEQHPDYQRARPINSHSHPSEFISSDLEATPNFMRSKNLPLRNRRPRINYESESDGVDKTIQLRKKEFEKRRLQKEMKRKGRPRTVSPVEEKQPVSPQKDSSTTSILRPNSISSFFPALKDKKSTDVLDTESSYPSLPHPSQQNIKGAQPITKRRQSFDDSGSPDNYSHLVEAGAHITKFSGDLGRDVSKSSSSSRQNGQDIMGGRADTPNCDANENPSSSAVFVPRLNLEDMWSDVTVNDLSLDCSLSQDKRASVDCSLLSMPHKQPPYGHQVYDNQIDENSLNCKSQFGDPDAGEILIDNGSYEYENKEGIMESPPSSARNLYHKEKMKKSYNIWEKQEEKENLKPPTLHTGRSVGCDTFDLKTQNINTYQQTPPHTVDSNSYRKSISNHQSKSNPLDNNISNPIPSSSRTTPGRRIRGSNIPRSQSMGQVTDNCSPRELAERLMASVRGRAESPVIIINHHTTCDHKCGNDCKGKEDTGKSIKAVKSKKKSNKHKKSSKELTELLESLDAANQLAQRLKQRSEDMLGLLGSEISFVQEKQETGRRS